MPATARADVVGSLLRPPYLQEARRGLGDGSATLEDVRAAEDRAVVEAIAAQEEAEVDVVSDGEARRTSWIASISVTGESAYRAPLGGLAILRAERPAWFSFWRTNEGRHAEVGLSSGWFVVTEKVRAERDIVGDEYGFLRRHTSRRTKYTFPAPSFHRVFWN